LEEYDDDFLKSDDIDSLIWLGSDVITDMVVPLRRRIGNLPTERSTKKDFITGRRQSPQWENLKTFKKRQKELLI
jgi:hypothetical protein